MLWQEQLLQLLLACCWVAAPGVVHGQPTAERDTPVAVYPGVHVASGEKDAAGDFLMDLAAAANLNVTARLGPSDNTPSPDASGGVVMGLTGATDYAVVNAGLMAAHTAAPRFDGVLMSDRNVADEVNSAVFLSASRVPARNEIFLPDHAGKRDPFSCGLGAVVNPLGASTSVLQFYTVDSPNVGVSAWVDPARIDRITNLYLEVGRSPGAGWAGTKNHRIVAPFLRGANDIGFGQPSADLATLMARQVYWAADLNDSPEIAAQDYVLSPVGAGQLSAEITVAELLAAVAYEDRDLNQGYCVYSGIVIRGQVVTLGGGWMFRDDRTGTWDNLPIGIGINNMLHLPAEATLRLVGGTDPGLNTLTFHAWDSTSMGSNQSQAASEAVYAMITDVPQRIGGGGAASANSARLVVPLLVQATGSTSTGGLGSSTAAAATTTTAATPPPPPPPSTTGGSTSSGSMSNGATAGTANPPPPSSAVSGQVGTDDGDDDDDASASESGLLPLILGVVGAVVAVMLLCALVAFGVTRKTRQGDDVPHHTGDESNSSSASADDVEMDAGHAYHNIKQVQADDGDTAQYHNFNAASSEGAGGDALHYHNVSDLTSKSPS